GVSLGQSGVQAHEPFRLERLRRGDLEHFGAQLVLERRLALGQHLVRGREAVALEAHEHGVHAVGGRAGHEAHDQALGPGAVFAYVREGVAGHGRASSGWDVVSGAGVRIAYRVTPSLRMRLSASSTVAPGERWCSSASPTSESTTANIRSRSRSSGAKRAVSSWRMQIRASG